MVVLSLYLSRKHGGRSIKDRGYLLVVRLKIVLSYQSGSVLNTYENTGPRRRMVQRP